MALRTTRQMIEALIESASGLRVTQQIVEALIPLAATEHDGSVTETLTITDTAAVQGVWARTAADTLTITETVETGRSLDVEVTDILTPGDAAVAISARPAGDSLTVNDAADAVHSYGAPDSLVLSDLAAVAGTYNLLVTDDLSLSDGVGKTGANQVGAIDLPTLFYEYNDPVEGWIGYATLVLDTAVAVRLIAGATPVAATDSLSLVDTARRGPSCAAADTLTLTHTAIATRWKSPVVDTLVLTDTASTTVYRFLSVADALTVEDATAYYDPTANVECIYHPFVGGGTSSNPSPPPTTLSGPIPGVTQFTLLYPATSPTDTLVLRAPKLGNRDRLQMTRVNRETRGGTLIVYADPIWPKLQTLVLQFEGLSQTEADDLLDFMQDHLGLEIGLLDWEHRFWKGVIVGLDDPVVQDGKDRFSAGFEFEGELSTYTP